MEGTIPESGNKGAGTVPEIPLAPSKSVEPNAPPMGGAL